MLSPLSSTQALRTSSPFSTSTRVAQNEKESRKTAEAKETENAAAGEAMGATEKGAEAGKATAEVEELQKTLKEKDAKIKELTVSTKADGDAWILVIRNAYSYLTSSGCHTVWKGRYAKSAEEVKGRKGSSK
jgi:hypothetical protein